MSFLLDSLIELKLELMLWLRGYGINLKTAYVVFTFHVRHARTITQPPISVRMLHDQPTTVLLMTLLR